jgi:hypothetical protein
MKSSEIIIVNGVETKILIDYPYFVPIYFISFYFIGGMIVLNLFVGVIVTELTDAKRNREIEDIRSSFEDDLTEESFILIKELQDNVNKSNEILLKLGISLNKNKN